MRENTTEIGIARCRDRTYDIRLVRAVDLSEINHLVAETGSKQASPEHSGVHPEVHERRAYHREYYHRTLARRRKRREARDAARWLLANLEWPAEPEYIVPPLRRITRPLLRLPR